MRKTFTLICSLLLVLSMSQTVYARELTEWEPDGMHWNDKPVDAYNLYNGDIMDGRIHSDNDDDWFCFVAPKNGTVVLKLSNIPEGCDYDLSFWNIDGEELETSTYKENKDEKITYDVRNGFWYYIKVYSSSGSDTENRYRLSIDMN